MPSYSEHVETLPGCAARYGNRGNDTLTDEAALKIIQKLVKQGMVRAKVVFNESLNNCIRLRFGYRPFGSVMTGKLGCTLQQVIGNVIARIDPIVTMNPLVDAGRYTGEQFLLR